MSGRAVEGLSHQGVYSTMMADRRSFKAGSPSAVDWLAPRAHRGVSHFRSRGPRPRASCCYSSLASPRPPGRIPPRRRTRRALHDDRPLRLMHVSLAARSDSCRTASLTLGLENWRVQIFQGRERRALLTHAVPAEPLATRHSPFGTGGAGLLPLPPQLDRSYLRTPCPLCRPNPTSPSR